MQELMASGWWNLADWQMAWENKKKYLEICILSTKAK